MRNRALLPFLLLLAPAALRHSLPGQGGPEGWLPLFNGRDLAGWRAAESPESFAVRDGVLVVKGPRGHLFFEGAPGGGEFQNFVFEAEVLTKPSANSGIFIHSRYQERGWPAAGYEIQINNSHGDPIRTGSIYGVVAVGEAPAKDDAWFRIEIAVRRRNIAVRVDGKLIVNWTEPPGASGPRRLSRGAIAIQAHDPGSEVRYRALRVRALPDTDAVRTRAERQLLKPEGEWWDRMDYGPFLSATIGLDRDNAMLKAIAVPLGPEESFHYAFDTELLRVAAWEGPLLKKGVTYDGSHGGHPVRRGPLLFGSDPAPGVSATGEFADPRHGSRGPLPRDRGRYLGLYRYGERVAIAYEAAGARILESPAVEYRDGGAILSRTIEAESAPAGLAMVVSVGKFRLDGDGVVRLEAPERKEPYRIAEDRTVVVMDRSDGDFRELSMGPPVSGDRVGRAEGPAAFFVDGWAKAHPRAGAKEGDLPRLYDGDFARNHDDVERCSWFDGARARLMIRLQEPTAVRRVNTYTWHRGNRAPQVYTMWGHGSPLAGGMEQDLEAAGWTRIAEVDTRPLDFGGRHGVCVHNPRRPLGVYARLLLDVAPAAGGEGPFFTEIDVLGEGDPLPPLKEPALKPEPELETGMMLAGSPPGCRLEIQRSGDAGRVVLRIDPTEEPVRVKIAAARGDSGLGALLRQAAPAEPLRPWTRGGRPLWGEPIATDAVLANRENSPYVADDVRIPFDNPYDSHMRIGGFDFFADGDRAALCTWNGDVWVVSGLAAMKDVRWKRFATGLFETLGLKIRDGEIFVNGKDQITRLHDLDGDGEADYYECFNNDVPITDNFHEFAFDLQTDRDGNFYFSKAAPVLPGGRGFGPVIESHGTLMRLSGDGQRLEVVARGLRAPNGIGVGPRGELTAGDNEGTWVPRCKLHWIREGGFQGVVDVAQSEPPPSGYEPPLLWFPMDVDNSGGGQVWVEGNRWGPFEGDLLHLSYGQSALYKVMPHECGGVMQGAVFRLPVRLLSGAMRGRFHPADGQLWICGLKGWQTNAARLSAFQRVRFAGGPVRMPKDFEVLKDGVRLRFTANLDEEVAADPESYQISCWNYVWGPQYGSPEISALNPDPEIVEKALQTEMHRYSVRDSLEVERATVEEGGRAVRLVIPELKPVMQLRIKLDLASEDGEPMEFDIYGTIHRMGGESR